MKLDARANSSFISRNANSNSSSNHRQGKRNNSVTRTAINAVTPISISDRFPEYGKEAFFPGRLRYLFKKKEFDRVKRVDEYPLG